MNDMPLRSTAKKAGKPALKSVKAAPAAVARTGRPKVRHEALADTSVDAAHADDGDDIIQRIYQSVFTSVMSQRLTPGTKLPEAALCELFGVGRTVDLERRLTDAEWDQLVVDLRETFDAAHSHDVRRS